MSDKTYKWQEQPYVPWKGLATNSVTPAWSRPLINGPTNNVPSGPAFKARPIKHWRKQLAPRIGSGRSSTGIGMPMDRPGGSTYLGDNPERCKCNTTEETVNLKENITRTHKIVKPTASDKIYDIANNKTICVACNPETNVIKSASTILNKKYYTDSRAYLRSRNMTYDQKLSGTRANGIEYFSPDGKLLWPTNSVNGPQVRAPSDCPARCDTASGARYGSRAIYKPNNRQFGVQGAVSSSSRLERLKLNTITNNGNSFRNAFGSEGANAGKYHGTSTAPYFLKSKLQKCVPHHRNGDHTNCFLTPTGSIGQYSYYDTPSDTTNNYLENTNVDDSTLEDSTLEDSTLEDSTLEDSTLEDNDSNPVNYILDCSGLGSSGELNGTYYNYNTSYCCVSGSFYKSGADVGCTDRTKVCAINDADNSCSIIPCHVADLQSPYTNGAGAVTMEGKIYVLGGTTAHGTIGHPSESYDSATNTWKKMTKDMNTSVWSSASIAVDDKIYVIGGYDISGPAEAPPQPLNKLQIYSDASGWTEGAICPSGVALHCATELDNKIYVIGIAQQMDPKKLGMFIYDIANHKWATKTTPFSVWWASAVSYEGKIYVMGGKIDGDVADDFCHLCINDCHGCTGRQDMVWIYTPSSDTWAPGTPIPNGGLEMHTSAVLNQKIYVVGGQFTPKKFKTPTVMEAQVLAYDPADNTWSTKKSMSIPRASLGLTVLHGNLYAIGGDNGPDTYKSVEAYDPIADVWSNVDDSTLEDTDSNQLNYILDCSGLGSSGKLNGTTYHDKDIAYCCVSGSFYKSGADVGCTDRTKVCAINDASNSCSIIPCHVADLETRYATGAGAVTMEGKIYVLGGTADGGNIGHTSESYDAATNTWETMAKDMEHQMWNSASVAVNNTIYVIGGYEIGGVAGVESDKLQIYSVADGWTEGPSCPSGVTMHCATELDNKIYVIGSNMTTSTRQSMFIYDISAGLWTTLITPFSVSVAGAVSYEGKIYVIGGQTTGASGEFCHQCTDDSKKGWDCLCATHNDLVWIYTPSEKRWTNGQKMPANGADPKTGGGIKNLGVSVLNQKIYAVGGVRRLAAGATAGVAVYNPADNTWSIKKSMSIPRIDLGLTVLHGNLYAIGGTNSDNPQITYKSVEAYDPIADVWSNVIPNLKEGLENVDGTNCNIGSTKGYYIKDITTKADTTYCCTKYEPTTGLCTDANFVCYDKVRAPSTSCLYGFPDCSGFHPGSGGGGAAGEAAAAGGGGTVTDGSCNTDKDCASNYSCHWAAKTETGGCGLYCMECDSQDKTNLNNCLNTNKLWGYCNTASSTSLSDAHTSMLDSIAHPTSKFNAWTQLFPDAEGSLEAFTHNNSIITEHNIKYNAGNSTYQLGHNQFTGISADTFKNKYLGLNIPTTPPTPNANIHLGADDAQLPDTVDWTTKGAVAPDKNQLSCGGCWAFSAVGALEGAYQIKTGKFKSFSEQQLISCSSSAGNQGCGGGLPDNAFTWIEERKVGLCSGADYLYTSGSGDNGTCINSCKNVEGSAISSHTDVPKTEAALKSAVHQQPVAVAIDAANANSHFQQYKSGIFTGVAGCGDLDHAVLAVGYGTDKSGSTPRDYWKVKNSWGATWGENGYVRMSRGNSGADCGILKMASYPNIA